MFFTLGIVSYYPYLDIGILLLLEYPAPTAPRGAGGADGRERPTTYTMFLARAIPVGISLLLFPFPTLLFLIYRMWV